MHSLPNLRVCPFNSARVTFIAFSSSFIFTDNRSLWSQAPADNDQGCLSTAMDHQGWVRMIGDAYVRSRLTEIPKVGTKVKGRSRMTDRARVARSMIGANQC